MSCGGRSVKRLYEKNVKGYVYTIGGGPGHKMQLPKDERRGRACPPSLVIRRFLSRATRASSTRSPPPQPPPDPSASPSPLFLLPRSRPEAALPGVPADGPPRAARLPRGWLLRSGRHASSPPDLLLLRRRETLGASLPGTPPRRPRAPGTVDKPRVARPRPRRRSLRRAGRRVPRRRVRRRGRVVSPPKNFHAPSAPARNPGTGPRHIARQGSKPHAPR